MAEFASRLEVTFPTALHPCPFCGHPCPFCGQRGGDSAFENGRYLPFFWGGIIYAEMYSFFLVCLMFSLMFHRTFTSVILPPSRILLVQATGQHSMHKYLIQLIKLNCPFLGLAIFNGVTLQKDYPCLHACNNGSVWMENFYRTNGSQSSRPKRNVLSQILQNLQNLSLSPLEVLFTWMCWCISSKNFFFF